MTATSQIRVNLGGDLRTVLSQEGELDFNLWWEGNCGLPVKGAEFYCEQLAGVAKEKSNINWRPYSLVGWGFESSVAKMRPCSRVAAAINKTNSAWLKVLCASDFFRSCLKPKEEMVKYVTEVLAKKDWLWRISETKKPRNKTVQEFFDNQPCVFSGIGKSDVEKAYPLMQYMEGFYLIRDSILKALSQGKKNVRIVFYLPNDEGKYYADYPQEIEKLLQLDLGDSWKELNIDISFCFFQYGENVSDRPYIDKDRKAKKVDPTSAARYWPFLSKEERKEGKKS